MYSEEHKIYLSKLKRDKVIVILLRILILFILLLAWEVLARYNLINSFLSSSPSLVIKTIVNLIRENGLIIHIFYTFYETIISFSIASILGILIASLFWANKRIASVFDPYLTVLNSLPKVSLGPLLIIWVGANVRSIIVMAILISVFTTIINMYNAFNHTDKSKILLLKSFNASKMQIFMKLVFPDNIKTMINTLKINISLSLIGVIMGELLVSKKGLGYLITYGSQVFNLNLVITSIFVLAIISYILYFIIEKIQRKLR